MQDRSFDNPLESKDDSTSRHPEEIRKIEIRNASRLLICDQKTTIPAKAYLQLATGSVAKLTRCEVDQLITQDPPCECEVTSTLR